MEKAKDTIILMHSGIVNGYQLLCNAHSVSEQPRGGLQLYFCSTHFRPFVISFVFVTLTVLFLFWGTSLFCVYNLIGEVEL